MPTACSKVTSALTLNVIASLKFILTIIIPGVIEQVFAVYNWFGVGIYFVCLCVYSYLEIPLEVEKYEHALKLDEEEGDRFFLSPGGKFIQKTPILFMTPMSHTLVILPGVERGESDRLWGHHLVQKEDDHGKTGCFDKILCCSGPEDMHPVK